MTFGSIFKFTIPVLMGYISVGITFGLLGSKLLIPWYYIIFMSIFVYAGSAQFLLVVLFASFASYVEIALAIFFLNLRHVFYGFSMIRPFSNIRLSKPYLIFGLTDETFAILQTIPYNLNKKEREKVYLCITFLHHVYWIVGTCMGILLGKFISIEHKGMEFALTALFVVLAIELYQKNPNRKVLFISLVLGMLGMILLPASWMLVGSLGSAFCALLMLRGWIDG